MYKKYFKLKNKRDTCDFHDIFPVLIRFLRVEV